MPLEKYQKNFIPEIEKSLKANIYSLNDEDYSELKEMLTYHLGWSGKDAGIKTTGKRIRPLITLLCCEATGGTYKTALPLGSSVELLHNFSLIHDDIEDRSDFRRGRETVWKIWGLAQAINTGDLMFALANNSIFNSPELSSEIKSAAIQELTKASINLTKGQYLDISFETRERVSPQEYWKMISGKTASLLACSCKMGALASWVNESAREHFYDFGFNVGMAFQVIDDMLGLWGDSAKTGKSTSTDLLTGKKTFPILYAIENYPEFAQVWKKGPITTEEAPQIAAELREKDVWQICQSKAREFTNKALDALSLGADDSQAKQALMQMADMLIKRDI